MISREPGKQTIFKGNRPKPEHSNYRAILVYKQVWIISKKQTKQVNVTPDFWADVAKAAVHSYSSGFRRTSF